MSLKDKHAFAPIRRLAKGLRKGDFTSLELTEFFLDRLERLGPKFNAVATVTGDLARREARQADTELAAGRVPTAELIDGLLVLIGGIVLLTPGLLTDLAGFCLMVPGFRAIIRERVKQKFAAQVGHFRPPGGPSTRPQSPPNHPKNEDIIDV